MIFLLLVFFVRFLEVRREGAEEGEEEVEATGVMDLLLLLLKRGLEELRVGAEEDRTGEVEVEGLSEESDVEEDVE